MIKTGKCVRNIEEHGGIYALCASSGFLFTGVTELKFDFARKYDIKVTANIITTQILPRLEIVCSHSSVIDTFTVLQQLQISCSVD